MHVCVWVAFWMHACVWVSVMTVMRALIFSSCVFFHDFISMALVLGIISNHVEHESKVILTNITKSESD